MVAEVSSLAALDLQLQLIQAAAQRRLADENVARFLAGAAIKKEIVVAGKLVNFVI